jgi:hypothetical protein
MQHFPLAALIPFVVPVLLFAALIVSAFRESPKNSRKNYVNSIPQMQIWAQIIRITPLPDSETECAVTFADAANQHFKLQVPAAVCDALTEGDIGSLIYQGTQFIAFQ